MSNKPTTAPPLPEIEAPERIHLSRGKSKGSWEYNGCWGVFPFPADVGNVEYVRDDLVEPLRAALTASQQRVAELRDNLDALEICENCDVPIPEESFNVCGACYNKTVEELRAQIQAARPDVWEQAILIVTQQRSAVRSSANPPSMNHEHNAAIDQSVKALEAARDAQPVRGNDDV